MTSQDELMEDSMMKEYQNDVWDIIIKLESKNVLSSKWICKVKYVADRSKERLVARGFYQKEGINYEETFSPEARYTSIRAIMALASMMKWDLHHLDVKTTFLNGVLKKKYTQNNHKYLRLKTDELTYAS